MSHGPGRNKWLTRHGEESSINCLQSSGQNAGKAWGEPSTQDW